MCFGVGTGMVVGATKILFGAGLIYFIMLKYAVALTLTTLISEDFVNIAWDSAGVTTGPVTVPFVLSVGVGCSKGRPGVQGVWHFGMCERVAHHLRAGYGGRSATGACLGGSGTC